MLLQNLQMSQHQPRIRRTHLRLSAEVIATTRKALEIWTKKAVIPLRVGYLGQAEVIPWVSQAHFEP